MPNANLCTQEFVDGVRASNEALWTTVLDSAERLDAKDDKLAEMCAKDAKLSELLASSQAHNVELARRVVDFEQALMDEGREVLTMRLKVAKTDDALVQSEEALAEMRAAYDRALVKHAAEIAGLRTEHASDMAGFLAQRNQARDRAEMFETRYENLRRTLQQLTASTGPF